ncbi:metalloregulator ArsR/SmtB family transcription factor [Micromonospora sp. B11E3]|uniref:ArsR/SmtB family transcription factor n=1 Tax=Micromonospora sp. B11E3 TaxID=3153562 RepID=UPI00325FDEE9
MRKLNVDRAPLVTDVTVSTTAELLMRMYSYAHTLRGDFVPAASQIAPAPEGHEEALSWFFGDDFALGGNLAVHAFIQGWHDSHSLLLGLRQSSDAEVVSGLLRPPSATPAEIRRRNHLVSRICAGRTDGVNDLIAQCVAEGFERETLSRVLTSPQQAVSQLVALVEAAAQLFSDEVEVQERLTRTVHEIEAVLESTPDLHGELAQVTGGWTIKDAEGYHIQLVPNEAIRPFMLQRVVLGDCAIVVFAPPGPQGRSLAEVAEAFKTLGNIQRLTILRNLVALPATGQDLAQLLDLSEATIHHHTSALRSAGLITSEREGVRVYHHASSEALIDLLQDLRRVVFDR